MAETSRSVQRDRRLSLRAKVRISTIDPERDGFTGESYFRVSEETCANLSRGGAFVVTHQPIARGCRLMLELELPDGECVETVGRVVWSRTALVRSDSPNRADEVSGVGIAFTDVSPDQVATLDKYLTKSLPRPRPVQPGSVASHSGTGV